MSMQLFARLLKVDEAKRQITGVIANETVDAANEVFDYDTSKPFFKAWSETVQKASGGQSVGNVRAQHGKLVAGRLTEMTFNDTEKSIGVVADIVDNNEWEKITKGCYTGFSIGGKYEKSWEDKTLGKKRYTANPNEVSIVDLPCNLAAGFSMLKANGATEEVKFVKADNVATKPAITAEHVALLKGELANLDQKTNPALHKYMSELLTAAEAELEKAKPKTASPIVQAFAKSLSEAAAKRDDVKTLIKVLVAGVTEDAETLALDLYGEPRITKALIAIEFDNEASTNVLHKQFVPALRELVGGDVQKHLPAGNTEELLKSLQGTIAKSINDAVTKAVDTMTTALTKANETTNGNFKKLSDRMDAADVAIQKFAKLPAPSTTTLRTVEKGAETVVAAASGEQPTEIMGPDGKKDEVSSMIKALHHGGGTPLMKTA